MSMPPGRANPLFSSADRTRVLLSLTALSGSPTITKTASRGWSKRVTLISISTREAVRPLMATVCTVESMAEIEAMFCAFLHRARPRGGAGKGKTRLSSHANLHIFKDVPKRSQAFGELLSKTRGEMPENSPFSTKSPPQNLFSPPLFPSPSHREREQSGGGDRKEGESTAQNRQTANIHKISPHLSREMRTFVA